ncbi:tRNA-dihydrouridine synthase 3 [Knufia obscura]|uniref:tRNA-dihydrouridine(47) synthase [NAD(P)(+)] n=2 Tax=Knufia TaxID=430999 RepID=A0AAN8I3U3_9EURO|nr:tRNA-dihydrouridine synthase 3 [Knufia obscura]KAK5950704.1 tRNA-dihydrouridine synthase 3 [Knufia fluminis]
MDGSTASGPIANGHAQLNHEPSSLISDSTIEIKTESAAPAKRKLEMAENGDSEHHDKRRRGTAPIKEEYLVYNESAEPAAPPSERENKDDDAAEAFHHKDRSASNNSKNQRKKQKGQNKGRHLKASSEDVGLCSTRSHAPEFSPKECPFGDKCKFEHDLRRYLSTGKRSDLTTFDGICPVWKERGKCRVGWSCRFVKSHSKETEHPDGRKELVLTENPDLMTEVVDNSTSDNAEVAVVNNIDIKHRHQLTHKKFPTPNSDKYLPYLDASQQNPGDQGKRRQKPPARTNSSSPEPETKDNRAAFVDPPLLPSEKRRLYFGPDTPVLAPLTTQGNLPFRRLCASLGASFTYSEMAMSLPLLSGQRSEWALLKAHESEITPPTFISNDAVSSLKSSRNIVYDHNYNHTTDTRFGAQISANKPWLAIKTAEVLSTLLPQGLRVIDMNCGCPIDLVFKDGAGSALMDSPNKLDKMLRGMNTVSGPIPISCKIRTGTRNSTPTAQKLAERLVLGANRDGGRDTPCGVAALTLHGRSRQQRYTKEADWEYISETASLVRSLNETAARETDTVREADDRDKPAAANGKPHGTYFLGNGDVYSHIDYYNHLSQSGVDSVMLARGALIKPWLFEEIATNQYLDKTATERLSYIETFVKHGLSAWGSDTHGISTTRRFLLEYLSFTHRYVPIGLLEVLPPKINERPPRYKGRNELETLLASDSYKDWIRISEMYLGKVSEAEGKSEGEYGWVPKHKSNAWDGEAQG